MKVAIFYVSKKGSTAAVAQRIREALGAQQCDVFNIHELEAPDFTPYDTVILGTPIYAGKPIDEFYRFCKHYEKTLLTKRLGLFICGMNEPAFGEELKVAFPESIYESALVKEAVGGKFDFRKMNFIERLLVRKIAGVDHSISHFREDHIENLIRGIQEEEPVTR
jgi:menaquinone-dependent protoporphyrinogen oxidase